MSSPRIVLRDISFAFPGFPPLFQGLNLSLDKGRLGLVGPNGCGKTTLFQLIMGLCQPSSGQLFLQGHEVTTKKHWRNLRRQLGYLFQDADDQLFSPTVIEDVAFGPLNHGASVSDARMRAMTTLNGLGLDSLADRVTHQLSGGEKKLVSLATLLVMAPSFLLLDEPTNNLDPATRQTLVAILKAIDLPYMIISHDFDFLTEITEQLYSMDHGHLHQAETAQLHTHAHVHVHGDHPHEHGQD